MKKRMTIGIAALLSAVLMTHLAGCAQKDPSGVSTSGGEQTSQVTAVSQSPAVAVIDSDVTASEAEGEFSMTTEDGVFECEGSSYIVTAAGTYVLTGCLNGQIVVAAGENDPVVLELSGVTVSYDADSPIRIDSADSVEISAKAGTDNVVKDLRAAKTSENTSAGQAAIYAKADLKLKGAGTLVVIGNYNNGIQTTKDLVIQKLSLKSTALNNALKGGDSVTVKSGTVVAISTNGDGVKTENTNASASGKTRGDIVISGGSIAVYAAGDGFQAAHDFQMIENEEGSAASVSIYTGSYSGYTASGASTTSYKGVKVQNELNISAGNIVIASYDDGLHADYGTVFETGEKGVGTVNISGGTVTMSVYAPETKTGGGRMGPGGWGKQQSVAGADAIHADYQLNISGGTVTIDSAYEGLEGNVITVSGGAVTVNAADDGVNACKGVVTPQINVTGGYLDVTVSPNGDTDGIDSNGGYTQSGGVVVTRGPSSEMAAAIDADSSVTVSGGTLIVLGYGSVKTGGSVKSVSLSLHSSGSHTVKIAGVSYTFTNASAYGRTAVYSDVTVSV